MINKKLFDTELFNNPIQKLLDNHYNILSEDLGNYQKTNDIFTEILLEKKTITGYAENIQETIDSIQEIVYCTHPTMTNIISNLDEINGNLWKRKNTFDVHELTEEAKTALRIVFEEFLSKKKIIKKNSVSTDTGSLEEVGGFDISNSKKILKRPLHN